MHTFTDLPALSAALLRLRPRARANPGKRQTADVPGLGEVAWIASTDLRGSEMVGLRLDEEADPGTQFNRSAFVALLPEEMVPVHVTEKGRHIAISFDVRPGRFRCRDCGWKSASDAKGTHPGSCADCSAERNRGVRRAHLREDAL